MPQYRKLHTKTLESFDVNAMPDDFHRLTWILLPLISCKHGRGFMHGQWLRSKLFPLRNDVEASDIERVMRWFEQRGMIEIYIVDGRAYYQICSWDKYQGNTSKEADSDFPAPDEGEPVPEVTPEKKEPVRTNSGPTPDQRKSKSVTDADADAQVDADADARARAEAAVVDAFDKKGIFANRKRGDYEAKWLRPIQAWLRIARGDPDRVGEAVRKVLDSDVGKYTIVSPVSIQGSMAKELGEPAGNGQGDAAQAWEKLKQAACSTNIRAKGIKALGLPPDIEAAALIVGTPALADLSQFTETKVREQFTTAYMRERHGTSA